MDKKVGGNIFTKLKTDLRDESFFLCNNTIFLCVLLFPLIDIQSIYYILL